MKLRRKAFYFAIKPIFFIALESVRSAIRPARSAP